MTRSYRNPAEKRGAKLVDLALPTHPPLTHLHDEILSDYRLAYRSRQASLIGRREVLSGKAKFGIFGDGKEVTQLAMAKVFQKGDFRSGYYRDQTLMLALGEIDLRPVFCPALRPCRPGSRAGDRWTRHECPLCHPAAQPRWQLERPV